MKIKINLMTLLITIVMILPTFTMAQQPSLPPDTKWICCYSNSFDCYDRYGTIYPNANVSYVDNCDGHDPLPGPVIKE
ncbi:hypothetical protein [Belliella aquatica]|uniref:Uncharacterized protein n=1 Tax=Belliella aquatica TaxID=1323734 RepID=A0ABQ1LJ78_9BACT|nr:hypothetical protein [Belliella aquatica]MCH7404135.1 hypothetical protein [Belliella aquatica]GGC25580.1 hypothetical protein GCM10010993_00830 [Belliella aquatica]